MMRLTKDQLERYVDRGFILLEEWFSVDELNIIQAEIPSLSKASPGRVLEPDNQTFRAVHGGELFKNIVFQRLSRLPRFIQLAQDVLGSEVYIHQYKLTAKKAFKGDVWQWHQDYQYWHEKDGMPTERVINVIIFLDEVNEFNGPLMLIPHSHKEGILKIRKKQSGLGWQAHMTAQLEDIVAPEVIKSLVGKYGIEAPKGPAGSVLCFHPSSVHGSGVNMSPFDRRLLILTYNSVENALMSLANPRPDFLANRDFTPLQPLERNVLVDKPEIMLTHSEYPHE